MKKFYLLLSAVTALIFSCGQNLAAQSPKTDYKVLVLGDLHFDGMEYHKTPAVSANRAKERKRNCDMWKEATPQLLSIAAKQVDNTTPFVIQVGDFVQGDCDTIELQEKMITDGFAAVKKYFPDHKLLPVRGNHDIRMLKGNSGIPTEKAFFPLIAKELGVEKVTGTYTVRQGKDLYIFFDGFLRKKQGLQSLQKALADNPDVRYTFFISHLPVFNCCYGNPSWLVRDFKTIRQLLVKRNAIIICAHTHFPSLLKAKQNGNQATQSVVSSVGKNWNPKAVPSIYLSGYDKYIGKFNPKRLARKKDKPSFDDMKNFEIPLFESYKSCVGFAMLKVSDSGVDIEYYANDSGKPALVKKLR